MPWDNKPPIGSPLDPASPIGAGLSGFWAANEGSGPALDVSGHCAPAVLGGGAAWAATPDGPALRFDGASGRASVAYSPALAFGTADFALECVFYPDSAAGFSVVLGRDEASGREWILAAGIDGSAAGADGYLTFFDETAGNQATVDSAGAVLVAGARHHVVVRRRFNGLGSTMALFLNGVLLKSIVGASAGAIANFAGTGSLEFGRRAYSGFEQYFSGRIAYVRMWAGATPSDGTIAQLAVEPGAIFLAPAARRFFAASPGGGGGSSVSPSGIATGEAIGAATLAPGPVSASPSGIATAESFGAATLAPGAVVASPPGIAAAEALGSPSLAPGPVAASPPGIAPAGAVGAPSLAGGVATISPAGVGPAGALGSPTLTPASPGGSSVAPGGIASAEALGSPTLSPGVAAASPAGIASAQAFGVATLADPAARPSYFEADLLAYLASLDLVAFPGKVPQGQALPAITFARVGTGRPTTLDGGSGLVDARVQLSAYGPDYLDCARLSEALRAALHGFRGTMGGTEVRPALLEDQIYTYEPAVDASDEGTHGLVNVYLICYRESIPQPRG